MHSNGIVYLIVGIVLGGLIAGFFYSKNTSTSVYLSGNTQKNIQNILVKSTYTGDISSSTGKNISSTGLLTWEDKVTFTPKDLILNDFSRVKNLSDYDSFMKQYLNKKLLIIIIAAKTKDKPLWDKFWSFEYKRNSILQDKFNKSNDFTDFMSNFYNQILDDKIQIESENDFSVIFSSSKTSLQEAIQACGLTSDKAFFTELLYSFRATTENKYCERISASDSLSMHNFCVSLFQK